MAQKLSYSLIEKVGGFLKDFAEKNKLGFLKKYSFKQEKVSKLATDCLKPHLLKEIHDDLAKQKFSFSIDGCTIAGQNVCAIQVKYLREEIDEIAQRSKFSIVNRLLGLSTFKESSESIIYLQMLKDKLFINPQISNNFIGTVHDNARTLSGEKNGLVGLLRKEGHKFFNLNDPCHSLSLTIRNSVGQLPQEIMEFITKLHSHFVSPQRKAQLLRIQEARGDLAGVVLKTYIQTRWLSLGNSLERVMRFWDSLIVYMDENSRKKVEKSEKSRKNGKKKAIKTKDAKKNKELEELDYKKYHELLSNDYFKMRIQFLNFIISKFNPSNSKLQNPTFPTHQLKTEIRNCFNQILLLIVKPQKFSEGIEVIIEQDWQDEAIHKEWYGCKNFYKQTSI